MPFVGKWRPRNISSSVLITSAYPCCGAKTIVRPTLGFRIENYRRHCQACGITWKVTRTQNRTPEGSTYHDIDWERQDARPSEHTGHPAGEHGPA